MNTYALFFMFLSFFGLISAAALPQGSPGKLNGEIVCTTNDRSPREADLKDLGNIKPFEDAGFCLHVNRICPGPFNNACADTGRVETIELARKNNLVITATGNKKMMRLPCSDIFLGLGYLRAQCIKNGKVSGLIKYHGANAAGYVTVEVKTL